MIISFVFVESLFLKKGTPRRNQRPVTTIEMHVKKLNSQKRYVLGNSRNPVYYILENIYFFVIPFNSTHYLQKK